MGISTNKIPFYWIQIDQQTYEENTQKKAEKQQRIALKEQNIGAAKRNVWIFIGNQTVKLC